MKCAMDLMATASVNAAKIEEEKAARAAMQQKIKIARTNAYCEKLGAKLEDMANKGERPVVSFACTYSGTPLVATNKEYADRRISYCVCGDSLDLETMTKWFASYCFEVVLYNFHFWSYGCGRCGGYNVIIRPKPECIGA